VSAVNALVIFLELIMEYEIFFWITLAFVAKTLTIGSDFNFGDWIKHGRKYTTWYFGRESWNEHLKRTEDYEL
jgi:hypothetical protein